MIDRLPGAVLFACSMNAVRSPMAEAIMKHLHGTRVFVDSVGVRSQEVDGFAITVMRERGLDITRHRAKTFEDLEDESFDVVITLSPEAHHHALEMTRTMACEVIFWPTLDPTGVEGAREDRLAAYRTVRDTLVDKLSMTFPGGTPVRAAERITET